MIHQMRRCRAKGIRCQSILAGCVLAIGLLLAATARAEDRKPAYRRFAVIGSPTVQKSGLSDLIAAELLQAGFELVEREQLDAAVNEQTLASALGDDAPAARVRLGELTKADALILVNEVPDPKKPHIAVIVTECLQGARLSSDLFPLSTAPPQLAHEIAQAAARTRARFSDGVKTLIGVPAFLSRNFTYEYHALQTGYATLLQESLQKSSGVAVVEVEEAQAIRREHAVTGARPAVVTPAFVEGEYEVATEAGKPPSVKFKITIRTEREPQVIERQGLTFAEALQFVAGELPGKVLAEDRVEVTDQPFAPDKEFTRLMERADAFVSLGEWEQAAQLRVAALVIKPNDVAVRRDVLNEGLLVMGRTPFFSDPHDPRRIQFLARAFPFWIAAMESLEWEIRNYPSERIFIHAHSHILAGVSRMCDSPYAEASQRLKRDFLLRVIPLTYLPQWDDPAYKPAPNIINPFGAWTFNEDVLYLALRGANVDLRAQDYDLLLTVLNGEIRERVEPSAQLTGLLWGRDPYKRLLRGSDELFLDFVRRLEQSPRTINQIVAKVAILSWGVEHGRAADADLLRQVESLRADFNALTLAAIPMKHLTVIDELNRLHDLAAPSAVTRPAVAEKLPDVMEHGLVRLEKLQFLQKRLAAPGGGAPVVPRPNYFLAVNCDASLDILWNQTSVNLMREPGLLEEVAGAATRIGDIDVKLPPAPSPPVWFNDVKWDGQQIWISNERLGIWAVDLHAKVVARIADEQGLPPTEKGVSLQPIGPGRVIVVGNTGDQNRAFIGLIEKGDHGYGFRIIHRATRVIEPKYGITQKIRNDADLAFKPEQIGLTRAIDSTTPFVAIRRQAFPVGNMLLVNAQTLSVTAPPGLIQWDPSVLCGRYILEPTPVNGVAFWHVNAAGECLRDAKITIPTLRFASWWFITAPAESAPVFIIGNEWFMVDPATQSGYRLAPRGAFPTPIFGASWTHFGPIIWLSDANHVLYPFKVTVATEKLHSLPAGDTFGPERAPTTLPATSP